MLGTKLEDKKKNFLKSSRNEKMKERVVGETLRERMERQDCTASVPSPGP